MSNKLLISIYSHEDEFIELLYDSDRSFEGQLMSPQRTINRNGTQSFSFEIPIRIFNRDKDDFVENPRWDYIIHQYKIRVEYNGEINEFVCNGYTESRTEENQVFVQVNCISLAEFELSQIGYSLAFNETTLNIYKDGEDPNDPDTQPIGFEDGTIDFWENKIIDFLNGDSDNIWEYQNQAYYYPDDNLPIPTSERAEDKIYENDRIIGYSYDSQGAVGAPIYGEEFEEKKRIISCENSNIWNIQQDICETFECWPSFVYDYDQEGKVCKKRILITNELPDNGNFTIQYRKNLKNITRNVDASQIITKMYVTPIENENIDSGLVSISNSEQNEIGEDYLLDLSWYMSEDGACKDNEDGLINKQMINPNLSYDFGSFEYNPLETDCYKTNTIDVYNFYRRELKALNNTIKNKSLEEVRIKEEYVNAITEREQLIQNEIDSYNEIINKSEKEVSLCRKEYKNKDKLQYSGSFFITIVDDKYVIKIGKDGVYKDSLDKDLKAVKTSDFVRCSLTSGNTIKYEIYELDPITESIKSIIVKNIKINENADSAYFNMKLNYDPLNFHNKLIDHYNGILKEKEKRRDQLGTKEMDYVDETSPIIPTLKYKLDLARAERMVKQERKEKLTLDIEKLFSPFIREGYWENTDYSMYQNLDETVQLKNNLDEVDNAYMQFKLQKNKYNQTQWDCGYTCFLINNERIKESYQTDKISGSINEEYLYDIADWSTLEVFSNGNPNEPKDDGSIIRWVKGTDYEVHYGIITHYAANGDWDSKKIL